MTAEEQPERTQDESGHAKRRTHSLNVLGVVFFGAAAIVFGVVWKSMEPSEIDLRFEAQERVVNSEVGAPRITLANAGATPAARLAQAREDKVAGYYATMLAQAQGLQREAATKAMLVPAAAAVLCFVLGYVSFRARLIAAGIVLLGLTAVYTTFLVVKKDVGESEAALYILVIAVAGLSGLVCTTVGMVRILATSKGA